jgi:hypothetical protein
MAALPTLFAIGYEQLRPDAVTSALKSAGIQLLVDTRAVAAKPGFSRKAPLPAIMVSRR